MITRSSSLVAITEDLNCGSSALQPPNPPQQKKPENKQLVHSIACGLPKALTYNALGLCVEAAVLVEAEFSFTL